MLVGVKSFRSRYGSAVVWNTISSIFFQGGTLVANIVVAKIIGKELFGEYGLVQSTIFTVAVLAQVGTGIAATKYVAQYKTQDKIRAGQILGLCAVVSLVGGIVSSFLLLVTSAWIANSFFGDSHMYFSIVIASAVVLFMVINGYQQGALIGLEGYVRLAKINSVHTAAHILLSGLGAWYNGVPGAIGGLAISSFLRWALFHNALNKECVIHDIRIKMVAWKEELSIFNKFLLPSSLAGLTSMPAIWMGNVFLSQQKDGYAELGIFVAANSIKNIATFLPGILNQIGTVLINQQKGLADSIRYRSVFRVNLGINIIVAGLLALVGYIFSAEILSVYGSGFAEGNNILSLLLIVAFMEVVTMSYYQAVQSHEKMWHSLIFIAVPRDVTLVTCAYFMVAQYGAMGLSWAYIVAWFVGMIATIAIVKRTGADVNV